MDEPPSRSASPRPYCDGQVGCRVNGPGSSHYVRMPERTRKPTALLRFCAILCQLRNHSLFRPAAKPRVLRKLASGRPCVLNHLIELDPLSFSSILLPPSRGTIGQYKKLLNSMSFVITTHPPKLQKPLTHLLRSNRKNRSMTKSRPNTTLSNIPNSPKTAESHDADLRFLRHEVHLSTNNPRTMNSLPLYAHNH